ncbi:MAG: hypothetical protein ACQEUN_16325 [Pseudomonadota bacterium]
MKKMFIFFVGVMLSCSVKAQSISQGGAWNITNPNPGIVMIFSKEFLRKRPGEGVVPAFMVNKDASGCYVSVGFSLNKSALTNKLRNDIPGTLEGLELMVKQADLLADEKVVSSANNQVQGLDLGSYLYARKLVDADAIVALMLAEVGVLRMNILDSRVTFNMRGFDEIMQNIMNRHCP